MTSVTGWKQLLLSILSCTTMATYAESSDSDTENYSVCGQIIPYRFEPLRGMGTVADVSESSESEQSEDEQSNEGFYPVELWCSCSTCEPMPTRVENICCHYYPQIMRRLDGTEHNCITQPIGFYSTCLDRDSLETSYYEFIYEDGPQSDDFTIHEQYRYVSYRRFVRWIFRKLGRNIRKVLPSCVVNKIRSAFPSEQYCGFKYPRLTVNDLL